MLEICWWRLWWLWLIIKFWGFKFWGVQNCLPCSSNWSSPQNDWSFILSLNPVLKRAGSALKVFTRFSQTQQACKVGHHSYSIYLGSNPTLPGEGGWEATRACEVDHLASSLLHSKDQIYTLWRDRCGHLLDYTFWKMRASPCIFLFSLPKCNRSRSNLRSAAALSRHSFNQVCSLHLERESGCISFGRTAPSQFFIPPPPPLVALLKVQTDVSPPL